MLTSRGSPLSATLIPEREKEKKNKNKEGGEKNARNILQEKEEEKKIDRTFEKNIRMEKRNTRWPLFSLYALFSSSSSSPHHSIDSFHPSSFSSFFFPKSKIENHLFYER
jgi:hypothetical protein